MPAHCLKLKRPGRYVGAGRAGEFDRRNAVPGELLVRITPERVISGTDLAT